MNRRSFLGSLLASTACVAVSSLVPAGLVLTDDPERALWVPNRTYFDLGANKPELLDLFKPPWPLTPDWITREALRVLERNLAFTKLVNREYDASYINRQSLDRPIRVHLPGRFA